MKRKIEFDDNNDDDDDRLNCYLLLTTRNEYLLVCCTGWCSGNIEVDENQVNGDHLVFPISRRYYSNKRDKTRDLDKWKEGDFLLKLICVLFPFNHAHNAVHHISLRQSASLIGTATKLRYFSHLFYMYLQVINIRCETHHKVDVCSGAVQSDALVKCFTPGKHTHIIKTNSYIFNYIQLYATKFTGIISETHNRNLLIRFAI